MRKRPSASAVYVGVGSNKGDRRRNIRRALRLLRAQPGIGDYWNGVLRIRTALTSDRLLSALKRVEAQIGRRSGTRWAAREVDLDILLRGAEVLKKRGLRVPHPRMTRRYFVLRPLADLAPRLRHPVTGKTVVEHLRRIRGSADTKGKRVADFP